MSRSCFRFTPGWFPLLSLAALILGSPFVTAAQAAVTFAQQNANHFSSVSSGTIAFNASTTTGDLVIVVLYLGPSVSVSSVRDSQGNAYQQIGSILSSPSGQRNGALFYASNIVGGADSVTVTLSGVVPYPGLGIY